MFRRRDRDIQLTTMICDEIFKINFCFLLMDKVLIVKQFLNFLGSRRLFHDKFPLMRSQVSAFFCNNNTESYS